MVQPLVKGGETTVGGVVCSQTGAPGFPKSYEARAKNPQLTTLT